MVYLQIITVTFYISPTFVHFQHNDMFHSQSIQFRGYKHYTDPQKLMLIDI